MAGKVIETEVTLGKMNTLTSQRDFELDHYGKPLAFIRTQKPPGLERIE